MAPIKDKHVLHKRLQHNSPAAARQKNLFSDDEEDSTEKPKKVDRNRDSLVYDDEDDKPNAKWDRNLQRDLVAAAKQKQSASAKDGKARTQPNDKFKVFLTDELSSSQEAKKRTADEMRKKKEPVSNAAIAQTPLAAGKTAQPTASTSHKNASPTRPILTDKKPEKEKVYRPFNKLLEGVVLVISGIQVRSSLLILWRSLRFFFFFRIHLEANCVIKRWQWAPNINPIGMIPAHILCKLR